MNPNIKTLPVASVHHFKGRNVSRSYSNEFEYFKDDKDFLNLSQQLSYGWKDSQLLIAYALTPEEVEAALAERLVVWSALRESDKSWKIKVAGETETTVIGSDVCAAFEVIYTEECGKPKKGAKAPYVMKTAGGAFRQLVAPEFGGVTGYRRSATFNVVNATLLRTGNPVIAEIPMLVRVYENELDRYKDCIEENTHKDLGVRKLGEADKLTASYSLYQQIATEAVMGRTMNFKRGQAQKFHAMCFLIDKFPEQKLLERLLSNPVNIAKCDKEDLRKLKGSKDAGYEDGASAGEVLKYFLNPTSNGNGTKKMAKRADVEALSDQAPVGVVKEAAKAILNDDIPSLTKYIAKAPLINAAVAAIMAGKDLVIKGGEIQK